MMMSWISHRIECQLHLNDSNHMGQKVASLYELQNVSLDQVSELIVNMTNNCII